MSGGNLPQARDKPGIGRVIPTLFPASPGWTLFVIEQMLSLIEGIGMCHDHKAKVSDRRFKSGEWEILRP
jgi:hypothetical protein